MVRVWEQGGNSVERVKVWEGLRKEGEVCEEGFRK